MRIGNIPQVKIPLKIPIILLKASFVLLLVGCLRADEISVVSYFDGQRAFEDLVYQVEIGSRYPGSPGHQEILDFLEGELEEAGWVVERHQAVIEGKKIINLIARRNDDAEYILL